MCVSRARQVVCSFLNELRFNLQWNTACGAVSRCLQPRPMKSYYAAALKHCTYFIVVALKSDLSNFLGVLTILYCAVTTGSCTIGRENPPPPAGSTSSLRIAQLRARLRITRQLIRQNKGQREHAHHHAVRSSVVKISAWQPNSDIYGEA